MLSGSRPKARARQNGCIKGTREHPSESKNGTPYSYMHAIAVTSLEDCKLGQGLRLSLVDKFADHTEVDTFLPYAHSHIIISLIFLLILLFLYIVTFVKRSRLGPYSNAVKSTVFFYESKENPAEH